MIDTRPRGADDLVRFPARAETSLRLISILDDPDVSVREVGTLISSDPGLSARMLRLANSPYFGLGRRVGSIDQAIVLLGFSVVRALAVSVASGMLVTGPVANTPAFFWEHSVSVAAGTALAARFVGRSPGEAFTAGLLHDLGSVVNVDRHEPAVPVCDPRGAGEGVDKSEGADLARLEAALMGPEHAKVGARLLEEWSLPPAIVEAVRDHHEPSPDEHSLASLVAVGEALGPAFARIQEIDDEAARHTSSTHEVHDYLVQEELAVIEQIIVPTLERARLVRVHPTDVLQALRAESARLRALIDLAS